MDVAGVVLGSISLLLSLALGGFELQRRLRFRKPVFKVVEADFKVKRHEQRLVVIGPGWIRLEARGATRPILLTGYEVVAFQKYGDRERVGAGYGQPLKVQLEPERYDTLLLEAAVGTVLEGQPEPPQNFKFELYLRTPEESYVVNVPLHATSKKDMYVLDTYNDWWCFASRTYFRQTHGLRDRFRRLRRRIELLRR